MPLQMPHVSVCDSHNELPQSKHCLLAVFRQARPTASAEFLTSTTLQRLSAIDTEVINERGDSAVGVDRDVKVFMDQKVVSACLPNDTKIVNECFFHSDSCIELVLGNPRALILFTRYLAYAANPLRLKVNSSMNAAAFAHGEPHQHMQITAQDNQLRPTCCTGNEHRNIHGDRYVCDYFCVRDLKRDQEDNEERAPHHVFHGRDSNLGEDGRQSSSASPSPQLANNAGLIGGSRRATEVWVHGNFPLLKQPLSLVSPSLRTSVSNSVTIAGTVPLDRPQFGFPRLRVMAGRDVPGPQDDTPLGLIP